MEIATDRRAFFLGFGLLLGGCAAGLSGPASVARQPPPLWGSLTPGPFEPGISVDWRSNGERRIQVWHWFPAQPGSGRAMQVRDLGELYTRGGPGAWPRDPLAFTATGYDEPGVDNGAARLAPLRVASRAGATPANWPGRAVIVGQGFMFESPFHQHVMAEYLASWGHRVFTAPLTGPGLAKAAVDAATLTAQVEDLAFLATISGDENAALVGFDLGGMSAVALAGSGRVYPSTVIGIDSGVIGEALLRDLIENRADFDWANLNTPYVHFTRSAEENVARNLPETTTIFERGNGALRALVRIPQMRHADFGAVGAIENVFPGLHGDVQGNPALGHAAMIGLVRQALELEVDSREWRPDVRPPITVQQWPAATAQG